MIFINYFTVVVFSISFNTRSFNTTRFKYGLAYSFSYCAVTIIDVQNGQAKITAKDKIYYDESLCFDHYKVIDK